MSSARKRGTNENIATYGGPSRDYDAGEMGIWEAATDSNLVSMARSEVLEIYNDVAIFDDGEVQLAGATTNASYFRIIRPASGNYHDGIVINGSRFEKTTTLSDNFRYMFSLLESYSQIQDISASVDYDNEGLSNIVRIFEIIVSTSTPNRCGYIGCIAYDCNYTNGTGFFVGFMFQLLNYALVDYIIVDCLAYHINDGYGFYALSSAFTFSIENTFILYNCNSIENDYGFATNVKQYRIKNCLASGNVVNDFDGPFTTIDANNNASSDATAPGTSSRINQTFSFVNAASDDYHILDTDVGAYEFGEDLGTDLFYAFMDDIDRKNFRGGVWSIGFDEPSPSGIDADESAEIIFDIPEPTFYAPFTDNTVPIIEFFVPAPRITATVFPCPELEEDFLEVDWLIESPEIGLKWSYQYNPDGTWSHRLLGISDIDSRVDPGGGIGTVGSVTINAAEDGTSGSLLRLWEERGRLEGSQVTVKAILDPHSNAINVTFFRGRIDRAEFQNGVAEMVISDESLQGNIIVPNTVITSAAYSGAPPDSIGKALAIIYGLGTNIPAFPLVQVSAEKYFVAKHPMLSGTSAAVAIYDSITGAPQTTASSVVFSLTNTPATVYISGKLQEFRFGLISATDYGVYRTQDIIGLGNIFDGISNTVAQIGTSTFSEPLEGTGILGIFASFDGAQGRNAIEISATHFRRNSNSDTRVTGKFTVNILNDDLSTINRELFRTIEYRHASSPRDETFTVNNIGLASTENVGMEIRATNEGGLGSAAQFFELGDLSIRMYYQAASDNIPIYIPGLNDIGGKLDVDGGITGNAGVAIRNVSDVIHDFMQNEVGIELFDTQSFDLVKNSHRTSYWNFDGGIGFGWYQEQEESRNVIDTMARTAGCVIHNGTGGLWRLKALGLSTASAIPITQNNILFTSPNGSAREKSSSFRVVPGTISLIYNNYEVRYAFNPATRLYSKVIFVNDLSHNIDGVTTGTGIDGDILQNLCKNSLARYGLQPPLIIEAPWIGDDAMAESAINFWVRYFWTQRVFAYFESNWHAWCLQLGDEITIDHPYLPSQVSGASFEIHRTTLSPSKGTVFIEASAPLVVTFDYFRMVDNSLIPWYFWIDIDGNIVSGETAAPSGSGIQAIDITNTSPLNLRYMLVTSLTGVLSYLIADGSGELEATLTAPMLNAGQTSSERRPFLEMRGLDGILYIIRTNTEFLSVSIARK